MDKIKELELRLALVSDELINTQAELDNERQYQVSMEYLWALDRELLSNLKEHSENTEAKLAKAMEALRFCLAAFDSTGNITERHLKICKAAVNADAVLAELEKE